MLSWDVNPILLDALNIVLGACLLLVVLSHAFSFPVVQHGTRYSQLPGVKCGDLVLFDDPLPSWRHPWRRNRQWFWRIRQSAAGFRIYVMVNAPTPQWPHWGTRQMGAGGTRVCLSRDRNCECRTLRQRPTSRIRRALSCMGF